MAASVLIRPYDSVGKLQSESQMGVNLPVTILTINAAIDRNRGMTTISIRTTNSTLTKPTYEVPATHASQIEIAIAQQLDMRVEQIRKLISYRIVD